MRASSSTVLLVVGENFARNFAVEDVIVWADIWRRADTNETLSSKQRHVVVSKRAK